MSEYEIQEIPLISEMGKPPTLGDTDNFDQDAEVYLYSQRQAFLDLNATIAVLNPVAASVMQQAQAVASNTSSVQQLAEQVSQKANQVSQEVHNASQNLDAISQIAQAIEPIANEVTLDRERAETAASDAIDAAASFGAMSALNLVGISINGPAELKGGHICSVQAETISYLNNVVVDHLEVDWWGYSEIVDVTGNETTFSRATPLYPSDPVTVTVRAVDVLGNKSKPASIEVSIRDNQPPTGPIEIIHQTDVVEGTTFSIAMSGASDIDDDVTLTYEISSNGGLVFSKEAGILANEIITATVPDLDADSDISFEVRATDGYAYTSAYTSTIRGLAANIVGVKLVSTGVKGGNWRHIDGNGNQVSRSISWFNAHPVFGGIVTQVIDGQYMVKVPKFYYKRGTGANNQTWWISDRQADGFTVHPAFMLGSREVDQFWVGKYQASDYNYKLQSVPNVMPMVSASLPTFIQHADARNAGGVVGFRLWHYDMLAAIQFLYLVENATMDSQGHTGDGSTQNTQPVSNVNDPVVAQATYRGIVGLWGNVQQFLDGFRINNAQMQRRSYTGNWLSMNETIGSDRSQWPVTYRTTQPAYFIPATYLSSEATATTPDYIDLPDFGDIRYPAVGGHHYERGNAGLWSFKCSLGSSSYNSLIGSRLARIV